MADVAGRFEGAIGLFACPRATAEGWGELLGTEAACAWPRLTTLGAGGAMTCLGGAGGTIGAGCAILISGSLGGSGVTSGSLIFGGSTLTCGAGGSGLGMILGLIGSTSLGSGAMLISVNLFRLSIVFLAAAPTMQTTMAMM